MISQTRRSTARRESARTIALLTSLASVRIRSSSAARWPVRYCSTAFAIRFARTAYCPVPLSFWR